MTRQQIEQAALEYAANVSGLDYIGEVECEKAFMAGAFLMQHLLNGLTSMTCCHKERRRNESENQSDRQDS